jgi:hypothetical protein
MINWFRERRKKREAEELAIAQAEYDAEFERSSKVKAENTADYTQSIKNAMYLRSSINVTTSIVNNVKGRSGAETKNKKIFLRNRIKWMEKKLIEENGMVEFYGSLIGV